MKFFKVTAKCGHVGRNYYYEGVFFIKAENGKAAAELVRFMPRVKHHHKDAILDVVRIDYCEFEIGQAVYRINPYFNCRNIQEQRLIATAIDAQIFLEADKKAYGEKNKENGRVKQEIMRKIFRKQDKYGVYGIA